MVPSFCRLELCNTAIAMVCCCKACFNHLLIKFHNALYIPYSGNVGWRKHWQIDDHLPKFSSSNYLNS